MKARLFSIFPLIALAASLTSTQAASLFWDGADTGANAQGGAGTWNLSLTNWDTALTAGTDTAWTDTTGTSDTANFGGSAGAVAADTSLGALGLIFTTTGYTVAGTGTLTLGTSGINTSTLATGSTTINNALVFAGAQTWTSGSNAAYTTTLGGAINNATFGLTVTGTGNTTQAATSVLSGSGGLTKTGSGTLTLSGANTFTGGITFNGGGASNATNIGNIRIANSLALGPAATVKTIAMTNSTNGAIGALELINNVNVVGKNLQVGGRTIAAANAFLRNVSGTNTWGGSISIAGGGGGYVIDLAGGKLILGGTLSNSAGGSTTRVFVFENNGAADVTGVIQNGNASSFTGIEKRGTGTVTFTNANSYTGGTTISGGTLVAKRTTQVALGTGAVSVATGANLTIQDHAGGSQLPYTNALTLTGSGVSGSASLSFINSGLFNMSGTAAISGGTTIRTDPVNQTAASLITFTNVISGSGGLTFFAQGSSATGTPQFALTGANNYTGNTVLTSSGINTAPFLMTLSGADNRLPVSTSLVFGGTPLGSPTGTFNKSVTLALSGISQEVAGISTANSPATAGGYRIVGASSTTSTLVVNNPSFVIFNGIIGGSGTDQNNLDLDKTGLGTLTISGSNTYTGTTAVTSGTLLVDGNQGSATGEVSVSTGATLGGIGTIGGNTTISSGGIHAAGNATNGGIGLQSFSGSLSYAAAGSTLSWQLASETTEGRGTNFDAVNVGEELAIAGSTFRIIVTGLDIEGSFWNAPLAWDVFNKASSGSFTDFQLFSSSDLVNPVDYSNQGAFSFQSTTGDLNWSPVPEPTNALAGLLLAAGLLRRKRK